MTAPSIADYAPLSGRHSAALVSKRGSIDWLSFAAIRQPIGFRRGARRRRALVDPPSRRVHRLTAVHRRGNGVADEIRHAR